jgi:hypothetical protein
METTSAERGTQEKREARHGGKLKGLSAAEFARLWKARSPLDKATADEVARNMAELNKAEWHS